MSPMTSILLIEDDDYFRMTLAHTLSQRGYAVTEATDGEEGVRMFRAEPPDLVITDIVMPNRDGTETVAILRREAPDLGIIAMSAGGEVRKPDLYLRIAGLFGANRMLAKPFKTDKLLATVDEVLKETGARKPDSE